MSDTPRTDAIARNNLGYGAVVNADWARKLERELNNAYDLLRVANETSAASDSKLIKLERELNAAEVALSGRTVSCSNCNELAVKNAELRTALEGMLSTYIRLIESGDAGNWDPHEEAVVIQSKSALSKK